MNRNQLLEKWMFDNKVTPIEMESLAQIPAQSIRGFIRGDYPITDFRWRLIESGMRKHTKKPQIITKIPLYILQALEKYDNSIVMKKKIKKKEQEFINDLKKHGYDCRLYSTGKDHYVIENKERFPHTPLLLKGSKVIID